VTVIASSKACVCGGAAAPLTDEDDGRGDNEDEGEGMFPCLSAGSSSSSSIRSDVEDDGLGWVLSKSVCKCT
jgi:hypothetical protein